MATTERHDTSSFHQPLLSESQPQSLQQYVDVLPPYPPSHHRGLRRKSHRYGVISCSFISIFLLAALVLLWPSRPKLSVVHVSLDQLRFNTLPEISLDVTLNLTVRVRNPDFYSIEYDWVNVTIGYRGNTLGNVTSEGGRVKARSSSYVNATLDLDAVEILSDAASLVEDVAEGEITFVTESKIGGMLRVFFFELPLKHALRHLPAQLRQELFILAPRCPRRAQLRSERRVESRRAPSTQRRTRPVFGYTENTFLFWGRVGFEPISICFFHL